MAFYVKFWGTRGSIPTPGYRTQRFGGNTPCVEVRTDTTMIVCDAGSGLRELGMDIDKRFGKEPITLHLLLSHTHWDHIQGFPFFLPAYKPSTTIHVYGASKADRTSHQLLTGQMDSAHFPVDFTALGPDPGPRVHTRRDPDRRHHGTGLHAVPSWREPGVQPPAREEEGRVCNRQ